MSRLGTGGLPPVVNATAKPRPHIPNESGKSDGGSDRAGRIQNVKNEAVERVWETESPSEVEGQSPGKRSGKASGKAKKLSIFTKLELLFCVTHS